MSTQDNPATNTPNPHAQALGRLGKGIKKKITPALIRRNKRAAKFPRPSRRKKPEGGEAQ